MRWALQDARVLYFIDNEGVKEALISGTTRSQASRDMLVECMIEDSQSNSLPWYARIASPSNLADAPSRLSLSEVEALFEVLRDHLRKLFLLPVVNYFDDYPHVDVAEGAGKSQAIMEEFLDVLGWKIAREPEKRLPASSKFTVLGVVVDLTETSSGVVKVSNKPGRATEMEEVLEDVKKSGEFSPAMAAKVQGRMMFAEAQCCGRWLAPVLEPVKARSLMPSSVKWADEAIIHALSLCSRLLRESPCRRIGAVNVEPPCIVFTDGAYEDGVATAGAIVISPRASQAYVLSFQVPAELTDHWKRVLCPFSLSIGTGQSLRSGVNSARLARLCTLVSVQFASSNCQTSV